MSNSAANKSLEGFFKHARYLSYNSQLFSAERAVANGKKTESRREVVIQKVIDEKHLRPFLNLRQKAFRECRAYGTRLEEFYFRGGWVVPEKNTPTLFRELDKIAAEWKIEAETNVYPHYEQWVAEFASNHPDEAGKILTMAPTLGWVMRNNWFRWGALELSAHAAQAGTSSSNIVDVPTALAEQALKEIADELYEAKLFQSERHKQTCRQMLVRVRDKASALGALHPRLQEIADVFSRMIPALPAQGYIVGFEAAMIKSVAETVIDLDEFIANGFPPGAGAISIAQASLPLSSQQPSVPIVVNSSAAGAVVAQPATAAASGASPAPRSADPVSADPATQAAAEQAASSPEGQPDQPKRHQQHEEQEPVTAESVDWGW